MRYLVSLMYLGILNVLIYNVQGYNIVKMFLYAGQIAIILLVINYENKKQKAKSGKIQR